MMYSNSYGHPGMTNNPFVEDPASAQARFPDLNASTFSGYSSQPQAPQFQQQYQPQSYSPYPSQPQAMTPQNQFMSSSYYQGQIGPQPTIAPQPHTGFPHQQHQQYPVQSGYPMTYSSGGGAYPSTSATPSYLAEFDPYSQQQTQARAHTPSQPPHIQGTTSGGGGGTGPSGVAHPRDVIRTHRSGLEAWDTYSWKQLLGACDALKQAWASRKQQAEGIVRQYGGMSDPGLFGPDPAFGYGSQVDGWKQVFRDASDHFDTVAACTFQLHEVFNSYRQSADPASKRRVRESCNAAVKALPDWPSN